MLLLDAAAGSQLQEREWWQLCHCGHRQVGACGGSQCLNQVGQGQYQVSNAPTFLRSVVSSFPLLPLLSFCLEWFCEFPFFKYPRALEALRLNARSVRGLLAFNLSHACSS